MKKQKRKRNAMTKLTLTLLAGMLLTAFSLSATPATVIFISDPYGAPYELTVNGATEWATCISGTNVFIPSSDHWYADVDTITDYSSPTVPTALTSRQVQEMGWLSEHLVLNAGATGTNTLSQEAIWYIVASDGVAGGSDTGSSLNPATTAYWVTQAETSANYNSVNAADFELLVPSNSAGVPTLNASQVFLVPYTPPTGTPEPATLSLVGLALLGLGILLRRRASRVA